MTVFGRLPIDSVMGPYAGHLQNMMVLAADAIPQDSFQPAARPGLDAQNPSNAVRRPGQARTSVPTLVACGVCCEFRAFGVVAVVYTCIHEVRKMMAQNWVAVKELE